MITRSIIEFFIGLLPVFEVQAEVLGAFSEAVSLIININHYIPVTTFLMCLTAYFGAWLACALISAVLQLL